MAGLVSKESRWLALWVFHHAPNMGKMKSDERFDQMPRVPGHYGRDSAKGVPAGQVKLPPPVRIPKTAAQKPPK